MNISALSVLIFIVVTASDIGTNARSVDPTHSRSQGKTDEDSTTHSLSHNQDKVFGKTDEDLTTQLLQQIKENTETTASQPFDSRPFGDETSGGRMLKPHSRNRRYVFRIASTAVRVAAKVAATVKRLAKAVHDIMNAKNAMDGIANFFSPNQPSLWEQVERNVRKEVRTAMKNYHEANLMGKLFLSRTTAQIQSSSFRTRGFRYSAPIRRRTGLAQRLHQLRLQSLHASGPSQRAFVQT